MSKYIFITSNCELPEADLTNEKIITVNEAKSLGIRPPNWCSWEELGEDIEISYCENEDDSGNLLIHREYGWDEELSCCKDNKYTYMVRCSCDKKRAKQLLDYIKNNHTTGDLYICSIWAGDNVKIMPKEILIDDLNIDYIMRIMDNFNFCLKIKNNF
ncbi:hypothetical protein CHL78_010680 [Romboutsia weinsteinii]|uniref:Uncharacterized protein n=1 Tax=Romboutsia weinsteinii TaxID=2020949 RepID=A0A371J2R7_9FIRM|nr:hypothetical protein [Romboutsia weinsteinii]RDY27079.1 hypothetical protein CHL78_010680 [Romboutsia weinsteinii]